MTVAAIILAAGQGTRMKSEIPKVLHQVAGRAMVSWVIDAAKDVSQGPIVVVVGHGRDLVESQVRAAQPGAASHDLGGRLRFALQAEQKGTGHAVMCAMPELDADVDSILVLCGDTPLLSKELLLNLVDQQKKSGAACVFVTCTTDDAGSYGRIVRDGDGHPTSIREYKDASESERAIREWNAGVYLFDRTMLEAALQTLKSDNAQGELYLTDVVAYAAKLKSVATCSAQAWEVEGVNDRAQLARLHRVKQRQLVEAFARNGVGFLDLETAYIDADVILHPGSLIEPNVHLRGKTTVHANAKVGTGSVLVDVEVLEGAELRPYTVANKSRVGAQAFVGPFSHLREGSDLGPEVHIGNFVETKQTTLGKKSKANHLAYLGNGQIGEGVNIGAGTIFCNYDGFAKHTTTIHDGAFVGSDSQIVAPVTIGKGAYVGTGTTVTRDVPEDGLALSRVKQENKEGYAAKLRGRLLALKNAASQSK